MLEGRFPNLSYFIIKVHSFKFLIKVYFKLLNDFFFQWMKERFVVASVLVFDKFFIFIVNLSIIFLLTMVKLL